MTKSCRQMLAIDDSGAALLTFTCFSVLLLPLFVRVLF
eukprot:CAMPEP_0194367724 /NCGR_PEP_ID=MMETSP0174-20130528/15869_1 /TAXON_ID=216777 /ORGANISM="Proboscia alata, Strain PI-D3" /LENGTH=37 /DNA_ID= /DNA_START= /DNA_END= /DNA_ORIENTATION=